MLFYYFIIIDWFDLIIEAAGEGAEVRFCGLRPTAIFAKVAEVGAAKLKEAAAAAGAEGDVMATPMEPRLSDDDLKSIERNSDNYLGLCFVCPPPPPEEVDMTAWVGLLNDSQTDLDK